ncbi:MAG: AI-2E family transporter [Ignavibacteriales bacterium]|nr:AI-2E family transporter [Ignavibacteriales bacterium]
MKKSLGDPVVKFFVSFIGLFFICVVLKELQHIFIPLVIAYLLFFFFEPLNEFLKSKKIPLPIIIFIDLLLTTSLFYGISKIIIDRFIAFSSQFPMYEAKLNHIISSSAVSLGLKNRLLTHFNISKIIQSVDVGDLASGVFSSTLSVIVAVLLVFFFFIFINSGHDKIFEAIRMRYVEKGVRSSLKKIRRGTKINITETIDAGETDLETMTIQREIKLQKTIKDITEQVQKYVITKLLISLSVGVIVGFILWLFKIEFFIIWAFLAFLLNFIPNVGSVIAVILPALMALVQYESFGYAALLAAVIIVVQNIIGNIIEPKIFGDRLGLNPLVILLSLLIWGYIWGIVGMFLAVPLTAIGKIIMSNATSKNMRFITSLMGS